MISALLLLAFFIAQILGLYFLSHQTINNLFYFLMVILKNESLVYSLIAVLFLPGTILHESAHLLAALFLVLKVREVNIFPQWKSGQIKLGSVIYEKKDSLRSILVGIAPMFFALFFFWLLTNFKIFPSINFCLNAFFLYLIFTVSSTMFSSQKDLQDLIFAVPLVIIMGGIVYVFNFRIEVIFNNKIIVDNLIVFLKTINFYLLISLVINIFLVFIFKSFLALFKK